MTGESDLGLKTRVENMRGKKLPQVIVFSLEEVKRHFDENMAHTRQ